MFRDFFLAEGKRLSSSLVYLNLYDDSGEFLYQLAYDGAKGRIVRGRTEAY